MKSSDVIPFGSHEGEVKQLHREIMSYVTMLDTNIKDEKGRSFIVLQYKIDRWRDKIAVLEVALLCLSGKQSLAELEKAISIHSRWNDKDGWWECATEDFVNKVTRLLTKPGITQSFLLSCFSNHFNSQLPNDIQSDLLIDFLSRPADVIAFAMTSKTNWDLFKAKTSITILYSLQDHVALGEYGAAEILYSKYQGMLLTKKGDASYHSKLDLPRYQYVGLTPFQIALRNAEWKEADKMARYLSREEIQTQVQEIFPEGKLISYGCELQTAKKLLKDIYDAVINDHLINGDNLDLMTDKTRDALNALYDAVNPENYKELQVGLVFDMQIYLLALNLFDKINYTVGCGHKLSFWSVRVEELIASCLPTVYLRAHCRGIANVVVYNDVQWHKLDRRGCVLADKSSYFNRNHNERPGMHFHINLTGVDSPHACLLRSNGRGRFSSRHQLFYDQTMSAGTDFMQQYVRTNTPFTSKSLR